MNLKEYIQENKNALDSNQMSQESDSLFEAKLKEEFSTPKKGRIVYLKYVSIAACLALVITTFWIVQENKKQKEQLLANLNADSTGVRLEAVYEFNDTYKREDEQIIKVLIKTLLNDTNANVKIATIDALLKFPQNEEIRQSFIKAIEKETKPLVQIKLINSLSILREKRAQKPLEKIINDKKTFPIVKDNATLAMANLKQ